MADATLEALRKISRTLHAAGWAETAAGVETAAPVLGPDQLDVLHQLLAERKQLPDVARAVGRDPADLGQSLLDAIQALNRAAAGRNG